MPIALIRAVSPTIDGCELSYIARTPIDVARAVAQHAAYERCLERRGYTLVRIDEAPDCPDAVFVEDTAVVLDEVAIVTRPGAESRRAEVGAVATVLQRYRPLRRIEGPATLDGGDVLRIGRTVFVGHSRRTNDDGLEQLGAIAAEFGYAFHPVSFRGCLHLKSAVTHCGGRDLLVNPEWIDARQFRGFEAMAIDPGEPFAANILRAGDGLIHGASFPRTRRALEQRGYRVEAIDLSELEKAEGGVTCGAIVVGSVDDER